MKIRGNGSLEAITTQAHEPVLRNWTQGLPPTALQDVCEAVNEHINREGRGEIITSRWMKGAEWTQPPYRPIYESVGRDWKMASFFLGLIVWRVMMDRPEAWVCKRYPRQMCDFIDLTYFRVSVN